MDTLSAFTTDLNFSRAAACRTMTATTASGTSRFVSEHDDGVGEMLPQSSPFPVASRAIPVASGVTIEASVVGHTAPPNSFGDSEVI